jgi:WD40 repeat protein
VGTNRGEIQLWDVNQKEKVDQLENHSGRVGSLAWSKEMLTSGSRDRSILHWDTKQTRGPVAKLLSHRQEVCGLQWSNDDTKLASGGNDNRLHVWDAAMLNAPVLSYSEHTAAVKALSWSPHHVCNLLVFINNVVLTQLNWNRLGKPACKWGRYRRSTYSLLEYSNVQCGFHAGHRYSFASLQCCLVKNVERAGLNSRI